MIEDSKQLPVTARRVKKKRNYSDEYRKNKAAYDKEYREKKRAEIAEFKRLWHLCNKERMNAKAKARYEANREAELQNRKDRYRKNREEIRAKDKALYPAKATQIKAAVKAYRLANPEKVKASKKVWSATPNGRLCDLNKLHKRRAAKKATPNPVTTKELAAIRAEANGLCHYCRQQKKLTFDHVKPLAKGGAHSRDNIVMACGSCNSRKGAKDPTEFVQAFCGVSVSLGSVVDTTGAPSRS